MKVGVITFQHANNYGAMFQAYALSKYLEGEGHEVFIVDYVSEIKKKEGDFFNFVKKIYRPTKLFKRICREVAKKHHRKFSPVFDSFRKNYLPLTEKKYTFHDLTKEFPDADAFICGSDQVWNTDFTSCSLGYLLAFLPDSVKRISYAASLGKDGFDERYRMIFERELKKFTAISVREKSGINIVQEMAECEVTQGVDPTLLLEDYSDIIDYSLVPQEPYIFVYRLAQDYNLTSWMSQTVRHLAETKKMPIYTTSTNTIYRHKEYGIQLIPTPGQFLGLLEKANCFITNSFHGTVFTLLLQTPFMVMPRDRHTDRQNLRMTELLTDLQLMDRYIPPFANTNLASNIFNSTCHFNKIHDRIKMEKKKSQYFLSNAFCEIDLEISKRYTTCLT